MRTCANTAAPSVSLYFVTRSTNSQLKVLQQRSVDVQPSQCTLRYSGHAWTRYTGNKGSAAAQHAANCHITDVLHSIARCCIPAVWILALQQQKNIS